MNPLLVIAVPLTLVIVGMILNSIGLSFDQPRSSAEQDPAKRLEAERQSYRSFFDQQRTRFLTRQRRVGQYAWLVLVAFIASFGWLYFDTVNKTAISNQIVGLQTVGTEEGKQMVLAVTLLDGSNAKYLIKLDRAETPNAADNAGIMRQKVSSWEMSGLGTALSVGDSPLPLGIALKISN